jgi:hypothetical protein
MAEGVDLGPRSRVDPAGKARGNRVPRTEVCVPSRGRGQYVKYSSPHGMQRRGRRSRRY